MAEPARLRIERLGRRGEGVAAHAGATVFVPYALPGESVLATVEGERAELVEVLEPRPDRVAPFCPHYGVCGGCAVQTLPLPALLDWKRDVVAAALRRAGLDAEVRPTLDAHGAGRRRATFHSRPEPGRPPRVGFMRARSHGIVDIEVCPVLAPGMAGALPAARRVAAAVAHTGRPLDILVTATETGLDLDLRGLGPAGEALERKLVSLAAATGLARLSNHGATLFEARPPVLRMGRAALRPPPGAFLQATEAGEGALAARALAGTAGAKRVLDLFCGVGTFALRFAEGAAVTAVDSEPGAVASLARAAAGAAGLRPVRAEARDLFRRPLLADELGAFDALLFDPPRAGAAAQAAEIARSEVPRVVAVSCDPGSFARDAATLVAGGYRMGPVEPVDQFRHSAHVELVASFARPRPSAKRRRLLG